MILGLDTDILVNWAMAGAPSHLEVRELLEVEVRAHGQRLGVTIQILLEFQHVTTDPRRFESPLSMEQAMDWSQSIWDGKEVARVLPRPSVLPRAVELMRRHRLGRKRILDTALAATMESAGIQRFVNRQHFEIFSFLELVSPEGEG